MLPSLSYREGLLGHLSMDVYLTFAMPQKTCIYLHVYTQASVIINRNELNPQSLAQFFSV